MLFWLGWHLTNETSCEIVDSPAGNVRIAPYSGVRVCTQTYFMNWKKAAWIGIAALIVLFVLFDVRINFEISLASQSSQLDAQQEARYVACYAARDKEIHDVAFGTIDNPDVQKLYILNNRKRAAMACRQRFSEQWISVEEPFRFNVIDLRFRY